MKKVDITSLLVACPQNQWRLKHTDSTKINRPWHNIRTVSNKNTPVFEMCFSHISPEPHLFALFSKDYSDEKIFF